jgi:hypothetical protein
VIENGTRVRVKNYAPRYNGELGTVDYVDGYYVYVFLDCQPDNTEYPFELYQHEIEIV